MIERATIKLVKPPHVYQGFVGEDDVEYCDACKRRVWVWELHHLVPIAWGGSESRALKDYLNVWVKICGDCHATVHRMLDHFKPAGRWDENWITTMEFPNHMVLFARWGWQYATKQGIIVPA